MFFINKNSNNFSFLHLNHFFFLYNYKKKSTRTSSCSRHKRFIEQKKNPSAIQNHHEALSRAIQKDFSKRSTRFIDQPLLCTISPS